MSLVPFLLEPHQETPDACGRKDRTPSFLKDDGVCHKYSADTYLLQIYLYGKFESYYTFYLIHKFGVTVQASQLFLFVFLVATAIGTLVGGPVGDRVGRKYVIWLPFLERLHLV